MKGAALALLCLLLAGCYSIPTGGEPRFVLVKDKIEAVQRAVAWSCNGKGYNWGTVGSRTHSMWPVLRGGEVILERDYDGSARIPTGSFVVFDRGDTDNVLHRVVAENERAVLIEGDNNATGDGWFTKDRVHRLVVEVICWPNT